MSPEFIAACPEALPYLDSLITTAFSTPRWRGISGLGVAKITFTSNLPPSHPARAMPVPQHFRMAAEAEYERMIVPYPESDPKTAASVEVPLTHLSHDYHTCEAWEEPGRPRRVEEPSTDIWSCKQKLEQDQVVSGLELCPRA